MKIAIFKNSIIMPLSKSRHTLIDREDFDRINIYKWSAMRESNGSYYAVSYDYPSRTHTAIRLHRYLLNAPMDKIVDHKNMNTLDNRKQNIRLCDKSQNAMNTNKQKNNTSGERGIFFLKNGIKKKWWAYIWVRGKRIGLGCYETKEEAITIRRKATLEYHGEFARI